MRLLVDVQLHVLQLRRLGAVTMEAENKGATEAREADAFDLVIEELEDRNVMLKWACGCSTTCNCTTSSCVGWTE